MGHAGFAGAGLKLTRWSISCVCSTNTVLSTLQLTTLKPAKYLAVV